jgi:hypothetical protein
MIDAAMTSVEAKRSCFCRSCSSRAIARRISPISDGLGEQQAKTQLWIFEDKQGEPQESATRTQSSDR